MKLWSEQRDGTNTSYQKALKMEVIQKLDCLNTHLVLIRIWLSLFRHYDEVFNTRVV